MKIKLSQEQQRILVRESLSNILFMKFKLTPKEKELLLKDVLAGELDTEKYKRLFESDQPIFNIIQTAPDEQKNEP